MKFVCTCCRTLLVDSGDELDTADKRKLRKPKSPSQRLPRSVSEEVLALEGRFYPEETQMDSRKRRLKKQRGQNFTESD